MALDPSARKSNLKDSIKKYFVDNLVTIEGLDLFFDIGLTTPDLKKLDIDRWIVTNFGPIDREAFASVTLNIFCCTRKDAEGKKLAQVTDKLMGYLTDNTQTDGHARIAFYQSFAIEAWTLIGYLEVTEIFEGQEFEAEDKTKVAPFTVRLRWGCKI